MIISKYHFVYLSIHNYASLFANSYTDLSNYIFPCKKYEYVGIDKLDIACLVTL